MPTQVEIQESITNRIIDGLQYGLIPWRKPWKNDPNCGPATNVVSKRHYNGVNPLLLDLAAMSHGFTSRFWGNRLILDVLTDRHEAMHRQKACGTMS